MSLFLGTCPASPVHIFAFFVKVSLVREFGALHWRFFVNSACLRNKKRKHPPQRNCGGNVPYSPASREVANYCGPCMLANLVFRCNGDPESEGRLSSLQIDCYSSHVPVVVVVVL